jgi:hypothetical protein
MSFLQKYLSVFIYNLCYGAVSSLDYITLNDKMISQNWIGKYVLGIIIIIINLRQSVGLPGQGSAHCKDAT